MQLYLTLCVLVSTICADVLSDYVSAPDENYDWFQYTNQTQKTSWGNTMHVLNVTTQKWMDESRAMGPRGAIWDHEVIVIIPKNLKFKNISTALLLGGCNTPSNKQLSITSDDVLEVDEIARMTQSIAIGVRQIPNCPIVYPSDPEQKSRREDAVLAWAWRQFIDDPEHRTDWMPRLPMVKSAFQVMRAVQEFTVQEGIADIQGWIVTGASKRGWTSSMTAAVKCETCAATIIAVAPMVPIIPNLIEDVHTQWKSYNGFTFAFHDYIDADITQYVDSDAFALAMNITDPFAHFDNMTDIPKFYIVSSDDEFMSMEWTNSYYDKLTGEKHLLIVPNSEHSLMTGFFDIYSSLGTFVRSLAHGIEKRPTFDYSVDRETGEISVTIPTDQVQPSQVMLRHAQTLSNERRDFRWVVSSNDFTKLDCSFPYIPTTKAQANVYKERWGYEAGEGEQLCYQPIIWNADALGKSGESENGEAIYAAQAPTPKDGHWTGYYIEVIFPGDTEAYTPVLRNEFIYSTPGFTFPDTFPFEDCTGDSCIGRIV